MLSVNKYNIIKTKRKFLWNLPLMSFFACEDTETHSGPDMSKLPSFILAIIDAEVSSLLLDWKGALPDNIVYWERREDKIRR